jgi:tetratricopeptide (TPR) repeat protein
MNNSILPAKFIGEFNRALRLQNKSDFNSAIVGYETLIKRFPDVPELNLNLAKCYFVIKKYDAAAKLFHKLHINTPDDPSILHMASISYINLNKFNNLISINLLF